MNISKMIQFNYEHCILIWVIIGALCILKWRLLDTWLSNRVLTGKYQVSPAISQKIINASRANGLTFKEPNSIIECRVYGTDATDVINDYKVIAHNSEKRGELSALVISLEEKIRTTVTSRMGRTCFTTLTGTMRQHYCQNLKL